MQKSESKTFSFVFVRDSEVENIFESLNTKKASQENDIPIKLIKQSTDIFTYFLYNNFNNSMYISTFPETLKKADVIPVSKENDKLIKSNYHPISILPVIPKVFEKCMNE